MSLYPTPTRLQLLADIADGQVYRFPSSETRRYYDGNAFVSVNARFGEVERAGWVEVGAPIHFREGQWLRRCFLTPAGAALLAQHLTPEATA